MESHEAVSESIPYGLTNLKGFVGPTVQLLYQHFQIVNCEKERYIYIYMSQKHNYCHLDLIGMCDAMIQLVSFVFSSKNDKGRSALQPLRWEDPQSLA